jgi:4'-phosphopantetheinyl transferase
VPRSFDWPTVVVPQNITAGEVHVWAWTLDSDGFAESELSVLDARERERLQRFYFERDRVRFAISHLNLRRILGAYLDLHPGEVSFRTNPFGKPEISPARRLDFNLSHSRHVALLAIAPDTEVGIDVEDVRPIESEVAERSFSEIECKALAQLSGDGWLQGFYRCWTRKEAILKAEGCGLHLPLSSFDVSLIPGVPAELLAVRPPAVFSRAWILDDLAMGPETVAALATGSPRSKVSCFRLPHR